MSKNIWIHVGGIFLGYLKKSFLILSIIFLGKNKELGSDDFQITNELLLGGPRSFTKKSTAIKIGRAIFVPFILLSQLYDQKNKISK